ncbi:methionine synthase [Nitrospiraceae bacterium HYJII51-Mn-bac16s-1-B09]|uniref:Methionine synthase n=2 Tax=Candidatus Manganitrophus noduliformans TaxID=2606439 RepID=A0A7X6DM39_9BACT|nr:methionine synthase [Candidatus Manganitrophus noduliformans]
MGTMIQARNLTAADFGGPELEGCNENLNLTRPDVIQSIHEAYYAAGADIVETNTFGGTGIVLAEYGLQDKVLEINRAGAQVAKAAAKKYSTPAKPRLVAASMGPTTKAITVTGGVTFDQLVEAFALQTKGLIEGGVDLLLLETAQDTINLKAAAIGILQAQKEMGIEIPIMISATIERTGTMLAGQGVEALYASLEHLPILSIGLNCATGPEFMTDHIRSLANMATCLVSVYPNAGLPNEEGKYEETPESLAAKLSRFVEEGWINLIGGCCGTTPAHITAISKMVEGRKPRTPKGALKPAVSGIDFLLIEEENRPVIVGERTNVIGSRKFKELIVDGKIEEGAEIGRAQVRNGAQVIDVCMANPDRNELADLEAFLQILNKKVKAPIMIDSTDHRVIEAALKLCQGKCIVNSINLEDGEERFELVVPLLKKYGGAVVVGCIDEDPVQGMGVTRQRKIEIAKRSYDLLVNKYGLAPRDLIFDALVFPVGTGDANYIGSAPETIEGIRLIKETFPESKTILGVSNVSFGLPTAGREILNSVFLYHTVKAGLDYAIVNAEKLERYPSIPEEERRLAEDLIFWRGADPVAAFAAHFKDKKGIAKKTRADLPLDGRLARYIVEGSKEGLIEDLELKRKEATPLEIINGPLMTGMDEVGRLFNNNELIVAEVLQSAEAMKAAVRHLEQFMEKSDTAARGTILLATVKGDVHDIGKNLVEIILSNNGYKVVNLGIKVPPETLIEAIRKERPDMVGLSGLLVKSAQQMVITAQDFKTAGVTIPILVGGAALTKRFTDTKIAAEYPGPVFYAKDAMNGLDLANQWIDETQRPGLLKKTETERSAMVKIAEGMEKKPQPASEVRARSNVRRDLPLPKAPDFDFHAIEEGPLREIFAYINPSMLYGKHLGLKGNLERLLADRDERAEKLHASVVAMQEEILAKRTLTAQGVYRYLPCRARGEDLLIYDPADPARLLETFTFPRQPAGERLCLSDYCRDVDSNEIDSVALFVVTMGKGVRALSTQLKEAGEYLRSHLLQAIAIEGAEGFAEWVHQKIRNDWGIPDPPEMTIQDVLKNRYRGIRVSFGYPACPNLADQRKLFRLLDATAKIGVELTDGDMMDPEASVSALVFHHPEAKYFRTDT